MSTAESGTGMERDAPRWSTREHETDAGAVESRQWIRLPRALVAPDAAGAQELGRRYLDEVAGFSHGLVRPRRTGDGVALVLAGIVPLLRFAPPRIGHEDGAVTCEYPIDGGLLVARPGGSLLVAQRGARIRGKRMPIVEVPVLTPRLSSLWLHLVTPVNASVARPLVEGLRTPTVARDDRIRALVPLEPTQFDDAVRAALAG